jgi:ATP-dependent DNA helicase RecQ
VPTHLPEARASSMKRVQTLYHEELKTLLPNVERSLSLFTSSQRMKDAGKALEALEHVLVPQTRRERDDVAKQMLDKTRRAAALGTRAFMEGVDFPNLRLVNLEKIPFPVLTTLLQKRQQVIKDNGGDAWEDYYLPKAMLTFIQAFGRLIRDDRSEAKEGAFVLWDKRILNASYAFTLLEALPQAHNLKSRFHPSRKRGEFYERLVQTLGLEWSDFPKEDLVDESQKRLECIRSAYSQDKDLQAAVTALGLEFWEKDLTSDQERWPKQCEAIEKAMNGEDILVTLPTGFGKSMIFQLPALLQGGLTLVVSPLVALMNDQVTTFDNRGAPIRAINGSLPKSEQLSILQEVQDGNINLLYVSPERLLKNRDLEETLKQLQSKGTFRRVVLDEAHCLSMQGHDFRPDYRKVLFKLKSIFEHIPVSCLTATATREVLNDLNQYVGLETDKPVTASLDRTNIEYWCYKVGPGNADIEKIKQILTILDWLKRENKEPWTAIIYAGTQAATERLASLLISFDYRAEAYHAGRHARIRNDIQENFKEGKLQVIVATNAFGMGVDQPNVRAVIHYSPSFNVPAYVQEAGRAGRDGKQAYAILLHAPSDWRLLNWINDKSKPSERLAEKLRELLAERNGFYIGLPSKLVDTLKEEVSTDERLNANELLWLLDTLMQAGTLDYAYRVGSVRLLAHSWNDFQPYLSAEQTTFLERSGFKPGSKACTIDLTMLEPEEADSLCDALYKASRDSFGVAGSFGVVFRTYEPSLEIRLLDKVRRQEEFKEVIGKRLRKRATDLQTLRDYAEKHVCRRKRLLKFFDQEPEMNDAEHCCDVCNRESLSREPWEVGQLPFTEEMITFKYRPDRTVLEYLAWHQENWKSEKQYEGIGATRLKMVLRGQAVKPRKPEAIKLSYTDKNTRFFGRLEFVSERELGKALVACVKRGHVEQQAREYTSKQKGMSYRITALGLESLRNG